MPLSRSIAPAIVVSSALAMSAVAFSACSSTSSDSSEKKAVDSAFRDNAVAAPAGWSGKTFKLSADYPTTEPAPCDKSVCKWLGVDVDFGDGKAAPDWSGGKWADYVNAILEYVKEGQDPNLANEVGYRSDVNGKTRWFHVPWMAYDLSTGRDFIHGTTNERTVTFEDFLATESHRGLSDLDGITDACKKDWATGFETWAVGVYNEYGGWVFGQTFPRSGAEAGKPQVRTDDASGRQFLKGLPFPEGTLVVKFLTTNAPVECAPFLKGSPEWQIHRHKRDANGVYGCDREVQTSRLLQVDIAVVDKRSPTRWVYGTFDFNGASTATTVWERLRPLGVQWGSDSQAYPAVDDKTAPITQSVINPATPSFEHLGCRGRLNGPVDGPNSSCISCHGGGFAPPVGTMAKMGTNMPPIFGFGGQCAPTNPQEAADNASYFKDAPYPAPYSSDPKFAKTIPLDTSLQLFVALDQYARFATNGAPDACR